MTFSHLAISDLDLRCEFFRRIADRHRIRAARSAPSRRAWRRSCTISLMQQIDDFLRRSGRNQHRLDGVGFLTRNAGLRQRRHIGQVPAVRLALVTASARSLPSLTIGTDGRQRGEGDRRMSADRRLHAGAGAVEWHVHDVELRRQLEQFARQLRRRAGAGRREAVLAGIGFDERDEFLTVLAGTDGLTISTFGDDGRRW